MNIIPGVPPRIMFHNPSEQLTGRIGAKKASDLEERSARSIVKLRDWSLIFRVRINPITKELSENFTNLKGELELDFLVMRGNQSKAFLVDGEISHYQAQWMRDVDRAKTARIDETLKRYDIPASIRVPYWKLANQQMSDQFWREQLR